MCGIRGLRPRSSRRRGHRRVLVIRVQELVDRCVAPLRTRVGRCVSGGGRRIDGGDVSAFSQEFGCGRIHGRA